MEYTSGNNCPVCGAERQDPDRIGCPNCGFDAAFVSLFTDENAYQIWQAEIEKRKWRPLSDLQNMMRGKLIVGRDTLGVLLENSFYLLDTRFQNVTIHKKVVQVSMGEHHSVFLHDDGTVSATGNNEYGQCNVGELRGVVFVLATSGCTYAVRKDGAVYACGFTGALTLPTEQLDNEPAPLLKGWRQIHCIASGNEHILGLKKDGKVIIGGASPQQNAELNKQAEKKTQIIDVAAASNNCCILLNEEGKVEFIGDPKDPRGDVYNWKDIISIGAENRYSVGLGKDGRIRLAGENSDFMDMGRADAVNWENVIAIGCGYSVIAAIKNDGQLLLAGNLPLEQEIRSLWDIILPSIQKKLAAFMPPEP